MPRTFQITQTFRQRNDFHYVVAHVPNRRARAELVAKLNRRCLVRGHTVTFGYLTYEHPHLPGTVSAGDTVTTTGLYHVIRAARRY